MSIVSLIKKDETIQSPKHNLFGRLIEFHHPRFIVEIFFDVEMKSIL